MYLYYYYYSGGNDTGVQLWLYANSCHFIRCIFRYRRPWTRFWLSVLSYSVIECVVRRTSSFIQIRYLLSTVSISTICFLNRPLNIWKKGYVNINLISFIYQSKYLFYPEAQHYIDIFWKDFQLLLMQVCNTLGATEMRNRI